MDSAQLAVLFMFFVFIPAVVYANNIDEANNPNCTKCGKKKDCECK